MLSIQLDLFGESSPSPSSGKMSPASSALQTMPSDAFWLDWSERMTRWSPQGVGGRTLVMCAVPGEQSRGGSLTPNISEWPNDAAVCSLWQVLEGSVPSRFFLSSTACAGILRRAEKRGKKLPTMLRHALQAVAEGLNEPGRQEDRIQ